MNDEISRALRVLRDGGLILYPTDTIWGIGCDASNTAAVEKVFALKRRSDSKSLVLLADSVSMISRFIKQIPPVAEQLIDVNDKPMTIIYPGANVLGEAEETKSVKQDALSPKTVAPDDSVGIRIPVASPFCMDLVTKFSRPIVSTSANISGEPSPKSFDEISEEIIKGVDYVVDRAMEGDSTGRASQIIKLEVDGQVSIIRA